VFEDDALRVRSWETHLGQRRQGRHCTHSCGGGLQRFVRGIVTHTHTHARTCARNGRALHSAGSYAPVTGIVVTGKVPATCDWEEPRKAIERARRGIDSNGGGGDDDRNIIIDAVRLNYTRNR